MEILHPGPLGFARDVASVVNNAVKQDKIISGLDQRHQISDTPFYLQRLLEIGYLLKEVFLLREYRWQPHSDSPRVIDMGGDIGAISVLYWKCIAPQAKVTLVEANPATVVVAKDNLRRRNILDVEVVNAAVSEHEGQTVLHVHKPGKGYHANDFTGERDTIDPSLYYSIAVPTIKPSNLIGKEHVDLLKIDIEGAEGEVIRELARVGKLGQIDEMIIEFHNDPANPANSLAEMLGILNEADYLIENVHRSGRARKRRQETIDIYSIRPSDKIIFMFRARKNTDEKRLRR